MRLMATPDEVTGPMNLGNPVEFTISELYRPYRILVQDRVSTAPA
jgi:hypothetical protein